MARPTNKEREKRKKLLKYFKRDSEIYINFEKATEDKSNERMIYAFIDACSIRNSCNNIGGICCTFNDDPNNDGFDLWEEKTPYQELMNIDKRKHDYYSSILAHSKSILHNNKEYRAYQMVDEGLLIKLYGEKRVKEFDNQGYPHYLKPLLRKLTLEEKEKLKKRIAKQQFGTNTIIKREYENKMNLNILDNASLLVELDFTKPLKEIQEYIKHLHEEYQKNNIKNIFNIMGIEKEKRKKEEEIFLTNSHKPFNGLLADKLFIYDGKKMELTNDEIKKEIIVYWTKTKKISKDEITEKIIKKYYESIKKFIENEDYEKFLSGYN
jgi:hypothetical protein